MICTIAWKNIWRNKVRSLVVITAVFLGIFGGVFSSAVMNGATKHRIKNYIELESSHIRLSIKAFDKNNELEFYISNADSITNIIQQMPECEAVTARTNIQSMAATANANSGITIFGINPKSHAKVFFIQEYICDSCGNFFAEDKKKRIIIGDKLANKLSVKIKSKIVLTFQDAEGNLSNDVYKVGGIFHTSNNTLNEYKVYIKNTEIAPVMMLSNNAAHEIFVRLKADTDIEVFKEKLSTMFPKLQVQTWKKIDPAIGMLDDLMKSFMYIFMFIILLAIAFGIINTMLMVVMERVRELGMLKAIGMNKKRLFGMICLETVFLSMIGGVLGMLFSAVVIWITGKRGLDLSVIGEGLEAGGYSSFIYPSVSIDFFFGLSFLIIFTSILASIIPALRATRLKAAEAIRVEQ